MRIFLDANVLIDVAYSDRPCSKESLKLFDYLTDHLDRFELCTSCDLVTTIYYVLIKNIGRQEALSKIKTINHFIKVIEFGNHEIDEAVYLMEKNENFTDLEDTIQFVMARKERCDYIVSNDKHFYSHDVPLLNSSEALKQIGY